MKSLIFSFLALGPAAVLCAQDLDTTGLAAELEHWSGDRPGAIIALAIDGEATGVATAGRRSVDDDRPVDVHTAFELGSISKVFTALLAADAVADGVVGWDQPVAGGFAASPVTYGMLASHTAGLPRLPGDFPFADLVDPYAELPMAALQTSYAAAVGDGEDRDLPAPWAYSNLGSAVLGQAVAAARGTSYEDAVRERVLVPLGLSATWMSGIDGADTAPVVPGHDAGGAAARWHFDAYAPAGAWVSTAADMERFMRAMLAPDARWAPTFARHAQTGGPDAMGYGWLIRPMADGEVYWHDGGTGGFRTFVGVQPATGRGIVVLGARNEDVSGIGMGWLQGLLAPPVSADEAAAVVVADYVGDYPLAPDFVISVFADDGGLRAQATGQSSFALVPAGADTFAFEGVAARLAFGRDETGRVDRLVLQQGGAESPAPRRPAGSLRPPKPEPVELTAAQVAGLPGEYELAPGLLITISCEGSRVFAQVTGQPRLPVQAAAPDAFFYDTVDAQLSFQRDETGAVTGLVLHQGGRDMPAKKR